MNIISSLKENVIIGKGISRDEANTLLDIDNNNLEELCSSANEIRKHFCGNSFDICTIINAKSGRCSEDCKYCAQSAHYQTNCSIYPLLSKHEILEDAKKQFDAGVPRFSLVTSGKNISDDEVEQICEIAAEITKNVPIKLCGSFGLLGKTQYEKLYNAGIKRMHNNLETSKEYFENMCSTHTFDDKVGSIKAAQEKGMVVCSGGIFGIGESNADRVLLAFSLKELGITSVPINILNPVAGTPFADKTLLSNDELCKIVAVYRFILPNAFIRLAGGRGLLSDKGKQCFCSGANATISGDMLTTYGVSVGSDLQMLRDIGFEV